METKHFFCVKGASHLEGGKVLLRYSVWRQPLLSVVNDHIVVYPSPSNLNISWNWGSLAGLCLVVQIITGILLAMHYAPHVDLAFSSVQHSFLIETHYVLSPFRNMLGIFGLYYIVIQ